MPFEIGQLASDYEVLDVLGNGGMGCVYRVRNVISNRVEAMKVLLADIAASDDFSDRFIAEIRTLARLDHPNIAKFHTAFKVGNQLVMAMEFVDGFTLAERARQGSFPLEEILGIVAQTLDALGYAHKNGVVHRDIKPSNLMVTSHGIVKVMDFGIAKSVTDPQQTRPGVTMGSMLYMSPEQVHGAEVDARSDLYSLGIVLYELTAGKRPFEAENTFAVLDAQLNALPQPPIELDPSLPPALNEIILTALAKEPMRRFQTAEAFRNALDSVREPGAVSHSSSIPAIPGVLASSPPLKGRRSVWMTAGALACIGVLAVAAWLLPPYHYISAAAVTGSIATAPAPAVPGSATAPVSPVQPPAIGDSTPQTGEPVAQPQERPAVPDLSAPAHLRRPRNASVARKTTSPEARVPTELPSVAAVVPSPVTALPGPSESDLDALNDDLIKLHARADAVRASLDTLQQQQAASGLSIRQDKAAAASRLFSYLALADQAAQNGNVATARHNVERAESELTTLETFLGK